LPNLPPVGQVNSYLGKPGNSQADSSLWTVTFDRSKNVYSYNPISASASPTTGSFAPLTSDFLILLGQDGYQDGLALELPGEAALLRPGDSTTPLIFAVQQASCFPIVGSVKFLYAFSPGLTSTGEAVYGRIYASTATDGSSWQFDNQTEYQEPDGKDVPADADFPGYPSGFPGNCSASSGSATVASSPLTYFNNGATYTAPAEYAINPAGFFFENQNYANVPGNAGWTYPDISAWGMSEASVPISTGGVATTNYVGFLFEANVSSGAYRTRPVGFGNAPISGTTMVGGTFPNEDPTQLPSGDMSVTFGAQDPLNNGLYYFAKLTIPYDGGQASCASAVPNQLGILTCTYPAVAIASRPSGQYAVILSAFDANGDQKTLVLFQQP
jgi:hypothetical protein